MAFTGVESGATTGVVSSNVLPGKYQRLVLTFNTPAARDAALQRVHGANFLPAQVASGAYALRHLNFVILPKITVTQGILDQLLTLGSDLSMISISTDPEVVAQIDTTGPLVGVNAARAAFANEQYTVTGAGIGVGVLDTGWDKTQGDFENLENFGNFRMVGQQAVEAEAPLENTETNQGHGTHIVGTIVGDGAQSDGRIVGLAPGVNMVSVAVDAGASYAFLLDGFDQILEVQEEYNIRVTNHSYGPAIGSAFRFDPTTASSQAIRAFYNAGIVPVFAAGNAGPDEDTISADAQNPCAIGVAAGTRALQLTDFSSRGRSDNAIPGPDITAPGNSVTASRALNGATSTTLPDPDNPSYGTISGTSMAAPHVVASIALLLEADESLSFEELLDLLTSTARPMTDETGRTYESFEVGAGYMDTGAAIAQLLGEPAPANMQPIDCPAPTESATLTFDGTATAIATTPAITLAPTLGGFDGTVFQFLVGSDCALDDMAVAINWESEVPQDIDLELLGPDGQLIAASQARQVEAGAPAGESIDLDDVDSGLYTVRVIGYQNADLAFTGTFDVTASEDDGSTGGGGGGEIEPGTPIVADLIVSNGDDDSNVDGRVEGDAGATFTFDASGTAYDGGESGSFEYSFVFGNEAEPEDFAAPTTNAVVTHTYGAAGTYTAYVIVTDASGTSDTSDSVTVATTVTITVEGRNGTTAQLTVDRTSGRAPLTIEFDGSRSFAAPGETITEYCFDFGVAGQDPTCGDAEVVSYTYTTPGNYEPSLTVTSSDESEAEAKATVNVVAENAPAPTTGASGGSSGAMGLWLLALLGAGLVSRRRG